MGRFDRYAFSASPWLDEAETRKAFSHAALPRTLVIYCYDPRAADIPSAAAKLFDGEVFHAEIILNPQGSRVGSSTTMFPVVVVGGRAIDALRSITVAQYLFGIENVVVVHHSCCGVAAVTRDGAIYQYNCEHHADISRPYDKGSICIESHEASLRRDTALIRSHDGTPRHVNVFGFFYDVDTGALTEVVKDKAEDA
jgi:carbonic anhydrase